MAISGRFPIGSGAYTAPSNTLRPNMHPSGYEQDLRIKKLASTITNRDLDPSSDDELTENGRPGPLTVFEKQAHIPALAMTMPCSEENIKGSTLISTVHDIVRNKYEAIIRIERSAPIIRNGVLFIQKPADWFMTLGGWKGMTPSEEIQEYYFYSFNPRKRGEKFAGVHVYQDGVTFPIRDHRLYWEWPQIPWLSITSGKADLSYRQIVTAIQAIKQIFYVNDSEIAALQLYALSRQAPAPSWLREFSMQEEIEVFQFLGYLNSLMFGIEASGLNAALATGLMTLDLIVDGRLDYQTAFQANKDGGVYPFACFGNNKGTYSEREEILWHHKYRHDSLSMKAFRKNPSLSPVAVKEAILIKYWLECNGVYLGSGCYETEVSIIEHAVDELITAYFFPWKNKPCFFTDNRFLKKLSR